MDMNGHAHEQNGDDAMDMDDDQDTMQAAVDPSRVIEVPLQTSELLEISLDELRDDETVDEVANLFRAEQTPVKFWIKLLNEYHRRGSIDTAIRLGELGLDAFRSRGDDKSTVPLLCMMASYFMLKSRTAPKTVLPNPRQHDKRGTDPKQVYYQKATAIVSQAESIEPRNGFVLDTKANLYLLTGKFDEAYRTYDHVLQNAPGHLFAMMGKARILYIRRQFKQSLKLYQNVLSAAPDFLPDPRIGIGLCFWNLGVHHLARKAWERSRIVNPGKQSLGSSLLLGLSYIHLSHQSQLAEEDRLEAYSTGIGYVQEAWTHDKTCAATAAALSGYFLGKGNKFDMVIKLGELAVQHADARPIISEGQLAIARALHAQGKLDEATRHYLLSLEANPDQMMAALGVAQMYIHKQDYPAAVNAYENILRKNPRCIEAMVSLASIHARAALAPGSASITSASGDSSSDKAKARELYDQVVRLFQGTAHLSDGLEDKYSLDPLGDRVQQIATDPDLYVDIARLEAGENASKSLQAYRQSLERRREKQERDGEDEAADKSISPQLLCNIGALEYVRGEYENAQERFEEAITLDLERQQAAAGSAADGDGVMMTLMYNLGVVMEARGQTEEAKQLYEGRLLARHPEFIEAKARLAALALAEKQLERCSDFLKAALTAQPSHLDIRALYVYFLVETGNLSNAKDFAVMTLKDFNKHDTYALSAMAHLLYQQARESRGSRTEDTRERISRYWRACEAFDRVIQLDPNNAYAAQGLAIALAENNLGPRASGANPAIQASNEAAQRGRNLRDALTILAKVRESVSDGSVYVNIGLCHFLREEWERAIENFETANNRFYHGKHLPTLQYLARARFHKANKDQNFAILQEALQTAQAALELAPKDDSIRFNIALIQQRGLETVQNLPPSRRRISEIDTALADAEAAQETFASLADNKAQNLPYSTDLADQRRRYGEGIIKRAAATIKEQEEWEQSEQNKVEMAKRDREAERARQAEVERKKREEARRQADELAARRKQMIEDARSWYVKPVEESEDEEEKGKKGKGRKKKAADDGIVPDGEGEEEVKPKKRRKKEPGEATTKRKPKKAKKDASEEPSGQAGSGADAETAEAGDEHEEDDGPKRAGSRKSKKQFRTKEIISDSDVSE